MKKFLLKIAIIIPAIFSCSSSNKVYDTKENALLNKWLNHSKSELRQRWGIADSTMSDGKHGEILIYKQGVDYKSVMNGKYTGTQYSFRKEMFVGPDSIIYYWKTLRRK